MCYTIYAKLDKTHETDGSETQHRREKTRSDLKQTEERMEEKTKKKEMVRMARYNCAIKKGRRKWRTMKKERNARRIQTKKGRCKE